jgi:translation initiation factor IF-2
MLGDGIVLESKRSQLDSKLLSAMVLRGAVRQGSVLVAGSNHFKVKRILEAGKEVKKAEPSMAVEF